MTFGFPGADTHRGGRGRDSGHLLPPAQTRAGAINAHGSYLGYGDVWRRNARRERAVGSGLGGAGGPGSLENAPTSSDGAGFAAVAFETKAAALHCGRLCNRAPVARDSVIWEVSAHHLLPPCHRARQTSMHPLYPDSTRRWRAIGSAMDSPVQVAQLRLQVFSICFPPHPIHSRRRLFLQAVVALPEQVDAPVMQPSCEPPLLIPPSCFAHTRQPAWPAFPARRPVRVRLWRVLLGRRPSLHGLRWRFLAFVSAASSVRCRCTTPRRRARRTYRSSRSPSGPRYRRGRRRGLPVLAHEVSPHAWVLRLRRTVCTLAYLACLRFAFCGSDIIGILDHPFRSSIAPAYGSPVQRFKCGVAVALAWLGARVVRYSFSVRLFHSLLHAGLSRRYPDQGSAPR